jgi:DNA-binding IscR family transcriptional regulator
MLKINKNVSVALKTIEFLKGAEGPMRTQDIAEKVGTSQAFLEQIMRKLRVAGISKTARGPGGGVFLSRGQSVTALDIAKALGYSVDGQAEGLAGNLSQALREAFQNTRIDT